MSEISLCQELVSSFNFHQFDEVKPVKSQTDKFDPRWDSFQHAGTSVVSLLFAAVAGDVTALQRMYLQGVDMAAADYDGRTALHLAAAEGHHHCVREGPFNYMGRGVLKSTIGLKDITDWSIKDRM